MFFTKQRRAIWLTEQQRATLLDALNDAIDNPPENVDVGLLQSARDQVVEANQRERLTLRLVKGYNTGLRLPEDAIPVRLNDAEASAAYRLPIEDERLRRFINPHQPLRGWRWSPDD